MKLVLLHILDSVHTFAPFNNEIIIAEPESGNSFEKKIVEYTGDSAKHELDEQVWMLDRFLTREDAILGNLLTAGGLVIWPDKRIEAVNYVFKDIVSNGPYLFASKREGRKKHLCFLELTENGIAEVWSRHLTTRYEFLDPKGLYAELQIDKQKLVVRFDPTNGELMWQQSVAHIESWKDTQSLSPVPKKSGVRKFLGIVSDSLFIATEGGLLVELDARNGNVIEAWNEFPIAHQSLFNLEKQQIIGFSGKYFWTLSLLTKQAQIIELEDSFAKDRIINPSSGSIYLFNGLIIFTTQGRQEDEGKFPHFIGVFDPKNLSLRWLHTFYFPPGCNLRLPLIITNGRLYVGNTSNLLFIFQIAEN